MKSILFVFACLAFLFFFSPRSADAQCRGSSCGPAVIQYWAPDQGHVTGVAPRPVVSVLAAPVRVVARVTAAVAERRPLRRLITAPFRWLRR